MEFLLSTRIIEVNLNSNGKPSLEVRQSTSRDALLISYVRHPLKQSKKQRDRILSCPAKFVAALGTPFAVLLCHSSQTLSSISM